MPVHVFVDESARRRYLLAASVVPAADVAGRRRELRRLLLPGGRRVHLPAEGEGRRRRLVAALLDIGATCRLYTGKGKPEAVRTACLRALVSEFKDGDLQRLVLESRGEHLDRLDRQILARAISRDTTGRSTVRYEHLAPPEQPALWISDAVAWCHDAGGDWRRRCQPLIEDIIELGCV